MLIPTDVLTEVANRRSLHAGIPDPQSLNWVETAVLTDDEVLTHLQVNVALGGEGQRHLGESAVISTAYHRGLIAILDDRAAVAQADELGVPHYSTLWLVVEAYRTVFGRDRQRAAEAVDGLLASGMYLPISDGDSLVVWAYEEGILP